MDHEAAIFDKVDKIMLPGDYIAFRMSGEVTSTFTGMSEGVFLTLTNMEFPTKF